MSAAATRGPVPDRSDQTVRRGEETEKVEVFGKVEIPELGIENCHPFVEDLYKSMAQSGQCRYYEPTDWQVARFTMLQINAALAPDENIPAMKLTALNQLLSNLLLTEGDRRRVRIEIERKEGKPEGVVIDAAAQFKAWLEGDGEST